MESEILYYEAKERFENNPTKENYKALDQALYDYMYDLCHQ